MNIRNILKIFLIENKKYLIYYFILLLVYPYSFVMIPKKIGDIVESMKNNNKNPNFLLLILLFMSITIIHILLDNLDNYFLPKLQSYLRINIVKNTLQHLKNNINIQDIGKIISKIQKLPIVIRNLVNQVRTTIIPIVFILFLSIIRYTIIDIKLGLICIIGLVFIYSLLYKPIIECLKISFNHIILKKSDIIEDQIERINKEDEHFEQIYKHTFACVNKIRIIFGIFVKILFISLIFYAYKLFKKNKITIVNILSITISGLYIIRKLDSFSAKIPEIILNIGTFINIEKYISSIYNNI